MSYWLEERRRDDEKHAERNRKAEDYDRLAAELARLRLTDAEREAISEAIAAFDEFAGDRVYVRTLRGLLKRLK